MKFNTRHTLSHWPTTQKNPREQSPILQARWTAGFLSGRQPAGTGSGSSQFRGDTAWHVAERSLVPGPHRAEHCTSQSATRKRAFAPISDEEASDGANQRWGSERLRQSAIRKTGIAPISNEEASHCANQRWGRQIAPMSDEGDGDCTNHRWGRRGLRQSSTRKRMVGPISDEEDGDCTNERRGSQWLVEGGSNWSSEAVFNGWLWGTVCVGVYCIV